MPIIGTNAIALIVIAIDVAAPPMSLAHNAQVYLSVFQNTGAPLNLIPNESGTSLTILRLGA